LVRPSMTFVLTFVRSFGTGTYGNGLSSFVIC
jgi:hypothetical protein